MTSDNLLGDNHVFDMQNLQASAQTERWTGLRFAYAKIGPMIPVYPLIGLNALATVQRRSNLLK
jgi:hypothetical protein